MTPNAYRLGSLVVLTGRFYSDAALTIPADPTTVALTIRDPAGAILTAAGIVNAGVGVRTYAWTPTLRGMHDVRWVGTGAVVSADQEAVFVLEDFTLGSDLTTVANVKAAIGITNETSDPLIQDLITSASAAIQTRYGREFAPVSGTPTRRVRANGRLVSLSPYDLRSASGITLDPAGTPVALAATDWRLGIASTAGTYQSLSLRSTYSMSNRSFADYGYFELDITGTWGMATIPTDVARAAILTVAAWLDRGADQIAGMDSTVRPDGTNMTTSWAIPTAAYRLLQPYERQVF
jgi:hypothetical protein